MPSANDLPISPIFRSLELEWGKHFPSQPIKFVVQAPGRVNLIGEHVDHQAYPVCPCAISQTVCVAASARPLEPGAPLLEVRHVETAKYAARVYRDAAELRVEEAKVWTNYVAAAYFGVVEFFLNGQNRDTVGQLIEAKRGLTETQVTRARCCRKSPLNFSLRLLFAGDVPPAAGLSSSAAVVVATTLAAASLGGVRPSNGVLADVCARAERYTGVASGGMDQAAILLSAAGSATLIHFRPLETRQVKLPAGGALLIANTCREAPKAKMAAKMYNKRVFELKAGCLALMPPEVARAVSAEQLLDLQLRDVAREVLRVSERQLLQSLPSRMSERVWTRADMLSVMGEERRDVLLAKRCGQGVWDENEDFYVYQRVRHVLAEAIRVEEFAAVAASPTLSDKEKLHRLGELMNASGDSLNTDFDCSCPEIEQVVSIARKHGAYGSRLTGAGWGGCTVSLVPEARAEEIISAIIEEYYDPHYAGATSGSQPPLECLPDRTQLHTCVFTTTPSEGAFVVDF
eukprot:Gregarina_sp_Pseudo_9__480@NODE_1306_length_1699_cov_361_729518_g1227_i0_p1_GENE_NODE_1306_length_1699_cov_361_729518_g1227_i0NODE_1306_length_1699_cov_361_729518_g1227_i0_p1_ORF_typecomplete_len516_score185_94GHMP_kinases_C/PF08544_13/4e22GalKase_gal_bdg/PF10509_9/2e17GHMP_kinases_N/PF00288_26/4_9e11_NODE_1306_length_1699_cov_361_729518_g1227_i01041651